MPTILLGAGLSSATAQPGEAETGEVYDDELKRVSQQKVPFFCVHIMLLHKYILGFDIVLILGSGVIRSCVCKSVYDTMPC